jgi:outer membrane murein-binding lipoprotein Lpp
MKAFVIGVVVVVVIVVAGAFSLNWVNLSTANDASRSAVTLNVNKDKVKDDVKEAKEAVQKTYEKAKEKSQEAAEATKDATNEAIRDTQAVASQGAALATGGKSVTGLVTKAEGLVLAVKPTEGPEVMMTIPPEAKLWRGEDQIKPTDLAVGQDVTVIYHDKAGVNLVHTVKITTK